MPHTSFYAEPARLAAAGYVDEHVERGGPAAADVLADARAGARRWRRGWPEPETRFGEFRFPGMLKIFFGGDPAGFAGAQAAHHAQLAERFETVRAAADRGEHRAGRAAAPACSRPASRLHRWWEARWTELGARSLLQ